jgi:glycosyltransferase involved in cell wall biosynthesis
MALVIRLGGPHLRHVLLGLEMRAAFASEYRLDLDRCLLLDNAALMPIPKPSKSDSPRGILHLANLSAAKGSLIVLEVASLLGSPMDAPLVRFAGPADSEVKIAIDGARDRGVGVTLTGPVYGDRKRAELESARVLLFPSYYDHEAQPLVVYEAAALGTVPIVWSAGWIAEQMANLGLSRYVFPVGEIGGLVSAAREVLSLSEEEFERLSGEVRRAFSSLQARCQPMLEAILGAEHEE